jgi:hypothetical protein
VISVVKVWFAPRTASAAAPVRSFSVDAGARASAGATRASDPPGPSTATQRPGAANPAMTPEKR